MHHCRDQVCMYNPQKQCMCLRLLQGVLRVPDSHLSSLHVAQYYLSVEHVWQFAHHLTLDGQLLVEKGQVVLQLPVGRDEDALTLGVILRTAGSTKHLNRRTQETCVIQTAYTHGQGM